MEKPSIYTYFSYQKYLRDRFSYEKEINQLTLRLFARNAGFSSHTFLKYLLEGKRSLTVDSAWKIARGFLLDESERKYLEYLIRFEHAETTTEKNEVYREMVNLRPKEKAFQVNHSQFEIFAGLFPLVLRELIGEPNFKEEPPQLSRFLLEKIGPREVKKAIVQLIETGLVKRNELGKLEQTHEDITTGDEVKSMAIMNYHKKAMELISDSLEKEKAENRDISSLVIKLDQADYDAIKKKISSYRKEIMQFVRDKKILGAGDKEKAVYLANFYLIPISLIPWRKK